MRARNVPRKEIDNVKIRKKIFTFIFLSIYQKKKIQLKIIITNAQRFRISRN